MTSTQEVQDPSKRQFLKVGTVIAINLLLGASSTRPAPRPEVPPTATLPDPAPAKPTTTPDQKADFSLDGVSPDAIVRPEQLVKVSQPEMEGFVRSIRIEEGKLVSHFLPLIPPAVPFSLEEGRIDYNPRYGYKPSGYFLAFRVPRATVFVAPLPGRVDVARTIHADGSTTVGEVLVYYKFQLPRRIGSYEELKIQFLGKSLNPLFPQDQREVRVDVGTPLFTSEGSFDLPSLSDPSATLTLKNPLHINVTMSIDEPRGTPLTKESLIQTADGKIAWYAGPPLAK